MGQIRHQKTYLGRSANQILATSRAALSLAGLPEIWDDDGQIIVWTTDLEGAPESIVLNAYSPGERVVLHCGPAAKRKLRMLIKQLKQILNAKHQSTLPPEVK